MAKTASSLNPNRAGLAFGALLASWHVLWAALVAGGVAQSVMNFIFYIHFIKPPYFIGVFEAGVAATLVAVAAVLGYVLGYVFAVIWNWLYRG